MYTLSAILENTLSTSHSTSTLHSLLPLTGARTVPTLDRNVVPMKSCISTSLIRLMIQLVSATPKTKNGLLRLSSSVGMFKESIQVQKMALMLTVFAPTDKLVFLLQLMIGVFSTFTTTLLSTILMSLLLIRDIVSMSRVPFSTKQATRSLPLEAKTRPLFNGKRSEYA